MISNSPFLTACLVTLFVALLLGLVVVFVRRFRASGGSFASWPSDDSSSSGEPQRQPLRSAISDAEEQTPSAVKSGSGSGSRAADSGLASESSIASGEPASSERSESAPQSGAESQSVSEPTAAELIAEGDEHLATFDYDDAIASYESAVDAVTSEYGRESIQFAELLVKTEDAYLARDNEDDRDGLNCNHYLRALSILERVVGVYDTRLLPVINRIVAFNLLQGKVSEAEGLVRRSDLIERKARQTLEVSQSPATSAGVVQSASQSGVVSPDSGKPSVVLLASAANLSPRIAPDSGNEQVDQSVVAGDKAHAAYDYDEAVDRYSEALEEAQAAFGRDSIKLVPILMRLGEDFHARDILDSDENGDTYSDPLDRTSLALSLLVRALGPRDLRLVPVLVNMVALNDQLGEHYKADRYLAMIEAAEAENKISSRTAV